MNTFIKSSLPIFLIVVLASLVSAKYVQVTPYDSFQCGNGASPVGNGFVYQTGMCIAVDFGSYYFEVEDENSLIFSQWLSSDCTHDFVETLNITTGCHSASMVPFSDPMGGETYNLVAISDSQPTYPTNSYVYQSYMVGDQCEGNFVYSMFSANNSQLFGTTYYCVDEVPFNTVCSFHPYSCNTYKVPTGCELGDNADDYFYTFCT